MEYNQTYNNGQGVTLQPDNNLVWAILSTVLCCVPTGIYAIIQAASVSDKWNRGDQEGAIKAASEAKKWSIIGAVVSVVGWILYILIYFVILGAAMFS